MAKSPKASLIEGNIPAALAKLAVPMLIGIVLLIAISLVDTFFVSQLGVAELAAMSFTFPVISLVISVTMGLGIGATSAIARTLGEGDEKVVRRLTTHSLLLALVVVFVISLVGLLTLKPTFRLLGADESLLPLLSEYMTIWYLGAIFLVVPMVSNGAIRASGDTRTPAVIMAVAALLNLAFDPLLIFGFGPIPPLGLTGAAIATLISRALTMIFVLWVLAKRLKLLDLHWPSWKELWSSWRQILSVGLPASISNALTPVAVALLTGLVAGYGSKAIAAYGLGSRIDGMLLIPAFALSAAMTPFIGQNWGAHRPDRVREAVRLSLRFVLGWGVVGWVLLALLGRSIASLFTDDLIVINLTATYLLILPVAYGAHGVVSVISAAFNAIDRAIRSTLLSMLRSLAFAVPLAWIGSMWFQEAGVFGGIALASILSSLIAVFWSRTVLSPREQIEPTTEKVNAKAIKGIRSELEQAVDAFLDATQSIPDVHICQRPINTIGFYFRGYELGHVHRTGHIDLHVPPAVHEQLIKEGKAEHHRHHHDTGWITHRLEEQNDVEESVWLLKLSTAIARIGYKHGHAEQADQEALSSLKPSPALTQALEHSMTHCQMRSKAA